MNNFGRTVIIPLFLYLTVLIGCLGIGLATLRCCGWNIGLFAVEPGAKLFEKQEWYWCGLVYTRKDGTKIRTKGGHSIEYRLLWLNCSRQEK